MENTTTESQSRNAAKVVGVAAAATLLVTATIKAKRAVSLRRQNRRDRRQAPLTVAE